MGFRPAGVANIFTAPYLNKSPYDTCRAAAKHIHKYNCMLPRHSAERRRLGAVTGTCADSVIQGRKIQSACSEEGDEKGKGMKAVFVCERGKAGEEAAAAAVAAAAACTRVRK